MRPKKYHTDAERLQARVTYNQRYYARTRLQSLAPGVPFRQIGPHCTVYCCDWQTVYALLPRAAAVVTDPPYDAGYDVTKPRRRPAKWASNFVGADQPFDPTPWLQFPEVILMGANYYWDRLPARGTCDYWDKMVGRDAADFAPGEFLWRSMAGPPQTFQHLWRGGMREGEENYSCQGEKRHPAQKPVALMAWLLQKTTAPVVIDPFMGSGSTLVACIRLGRPCIGIELDPPSFAVACALLQAEVVARAHRWVTMLQWLLAVAQQRQAEAAD